MQTEPELQNVETGSRRREEALNLIGLHEAQEGGERVGWIAEVEPWPEQVDGAELLAELERVLQRFVVLPKWAAETLALWIVHTYAFQLREVSAYLGIESPEKRCGKTTLLTVLSELVNRPVVAANISSPAFFRVIEDVQPTLLIDEADTFLQSNVELRGILNSGYSRKTAFVVRVANGQEAEDRDRRPEGRGQRLARYSCWCPKAVAAIGRLPETLADRCIVIRMQRKALTEQCERLRDLETARLRRQCARWVADHAAKIAKARPQSPAGLNDRAADIWEPLLALADLAGGPCPARARAAAVGLTAGIQERNPIGALLLDIFVTFALLKITRIFSRDLVANLMGCGDRPWSELKPGKAITEVWLARQLRPYGVSPRTLWIGETAAKGYDQADFREVFRRYISRPDTEALLNELERNEDKPAANAFLTVS